MNAEQKKRIAHEISNWKNACNCRAVQLTGDRMAALLQELIDAPEPEFKPVAWMYEDNFGTLFTEEYSEILNNPGVLSFTPLYTAPPAPSVPDGWMRAIDEAMVIHHLGIADKSDSYEEAQKKLNTLLSLNQDIGEYFSGKTSEPPADVARDAEPVAYVTGVYGGHTTVDPIDGKRVLRVGMALYTAPPEPPADVARDAEKNRKIAIAAMCCKKITFTEGGPVYDAAGCVMDSFDPEAVVVAGSGQRYVADSIEAALLEMYRAEFEPDAAAIERQGGE